MSAQTTLIGNSTADIEIRYSQAGKPVGNLTVAVSDRKFDKKSNQWVDGDTWFARCVILGEMAEHAAASIPKGTRVVAVGKIAQREWQDRDGQKRVSVEVVVDEIGPSLRYATAQVTRTGGTAGAESRSTPQTGTWSTPTEMGPQTGVQGFDTEVPF